MAIISQKRIRSLPRHLPEAAKGEGIILCVKITDAITKRLELAGFNHNLENGDAILLAALGPVSRVNANGKDIVRRDLQKETIYYDREHSYTEWHGKTRILCTKIVEIPYKRYPRELVSPPSVEISIATILQGERYVIASPEVYIARNEAAIVHKVNLFLELFGECEIRRKDLTPFLKSSERRINWHILPEGQLPWESVEKIVRPIVARKPKRIQPVAWERLEIVEDHRPDFHAIGRGGFSGYIVFGFEQLELYVLESLHYGNATYVFDRDWKRLSSLSKAEILDSKQHKERIIHRRKTWRDRIEKLLRYSSSEAA